MNEPGPLLIVAPLRMELAGVVARLESGMLAGVPVVTAVVGDGARRARSTLRPLLAASAPRALVCLGVAGGLDPSLAWGTVLASGEVVGGAAPSPAPDPTWQARARAADVPLASFAVAARIVPTPGAKSALREALGGVAACVDLESAVFAEEADRAGVPYLILRAVIDEAGDTVAKSILAAEDEDGHVVTAKVVAGAMLRPGEIRRLKEMQKRVETCAERLADAVDALLGRG